MPSPNIFDWIAFALIVIGALAWGPFIFDVNILDLLLEMIWDPLDNIAFAIIAIGGVYAIVRTVVSRAERSG